MARFLEPTMTGALWGSRLSGKGEKPAADKETEASGPTACDRLCEGGRPAQGSPWAPLLDGSYRTSTNLGNNIKCR